MRLRIKIARCIRAFAVLTLALTLTSETALPADSDRRYSGPIISVDFQETPVATVFRVLSELGGQRNIVVDPDVVGTVTLKLKDVPWEQVMEIVLRQKGLYMESLPGATDTAVRVRPLH